MSSSTLSTSTASTPEPLAEEFAPVFDDIPLTSTQRALFYRLAHGHTQDATMLMNLLSPEEFYAVDANGRTFLHFVRNRNLAANLIARGVEQYRWDANAESASVLARRRGEATVADFIEGLALGDLHTYDPVPRRTRRRQSDASPSQTSGNLAIFQAIQDNYLKIVMKRGLNSEQASAVDGNRRTLLHFASSVEMATYLVETLDLSPDALDSFGNTPAMLARQRGNDEVAEYLESKMQNAALSGLYYAVAALLFSGAFGGSVL